MAVWPGCDSDLLPYGYCGLDHRAHVHSLGRGWSRGADQGSGSLLVAVLAYLVMSHRRVEHLTFNFPELTLSLLAVMLLQVNTPATAIGLYRFRGDGFQVVDVIKLISPFALRGLSILGMNARNISFIGRYNRRDNYRLVDNKLLTKSAALERDIPVPRLSGTIEYQFQVRIFSVFCRVVTAL